MFVISSCQEKIDTLQIHHAAEFNKWSNKTLFNFCVFTQALIDQDFQKKISVENCGAILNQELLLNKSQKENVILTTNLKLLTEFLQWYDSFWIKPQSYSFKNIDYIAMARFLVYKDTCIFL